MEQPQLRSPVDYINVKDSQKSMTKIHRVCTQLMLNLSYLKLMSELCCCFENR